MPALTYQRIYGDAFNGSLGDVYLFDIATPMLGDAFNGSLADGYMYDAAQQMRGDSFNGSLGDIYLVSTPDGTILSYPMYGDAFAGAMGEGRMFIDPSEAAIRAYWFEAQAQVDGSIADCGLTDGAAESEWHA